MEAFIKARQKLLITLTLIVGIAGYALIAFYYWHQSTVYVKTNNAYVQAAAMADAKPKLTAQLMEWNVKVGEAVTKGQIIGRLSSAGVPDEQTEDTLVRAPISGTVIAQFFQPGEVVAEGSIMARVADLSQLQVLAFVKETERNKLRTGAPVTIRLDSTPGRLYGGTLTDIGDATAFEKFGGVASTGGTFTKEVQMVPVTIAFTHLPGSVVELGMSAEVRIDSAMEQAREGRGKHE